MGFCGHSLRFVFGNVGVRIRAQVGWLRSRVPFVRRCAARHVPRGWGGAALPIRKSRCAPRQFFVEHTFEKTQNTEAAVTPKPALRAPAGFGCAASSPAAEGLGRSP